MNDWMNAHESDPVQALKRAVQARGMLELTAAELGARFGAVRLTRAARDRIDAELCDAGLVVEPSFREAQRNERLRVTVAGRSRPPKATHASSGAETGSAARPRRNRRWLAAGVIAALLLLIVVLSGGEKDPSRSSGRSDVKDHAALAPATQAAVKSDPGRVARRRARALAARGRYGAAARVLDRAGTDPGLARRLRHRGARSLLRRARTALVASHEDAARRYARRARRLGASAGAHAVMADANRQSAAERAAARERRRLAAIARDARTCSADEKSAVDSGAATPSGCTSYAAEVAAKVAAAQTSDSRCDPNYSGACLDPDASDYDCAGGSGDGPEYTGTVEVVGDDHFDLDRDGDGVACDT